MYFKTKWNIEHAYSVKLALGLRDSALITLMLIMMMDRFSQQF